MKLLTQTEYKKAQKAAVKNAATRRQSIFELLTVNAAGQTDETLADLLASFDAQGDEPICELIRVEQFNRFCK